MPVKARAPARARHRPRRHRRAARCGPAGLRHPLAPDAGHSPSLAVVPAVPGYDTEEGERVMRVGAATPSPRRQERPASRGQQYVVTVAVMAGTFLAVMDISVVNVSLPHMMGNFGQTLSAITWVATSYSIAEMLMITMAGWWSALIGRKRLYLASFVLFTLGSMLAGTAQTFPQRSEERRVGKECRSRWSPDH